MSVTFLICMSVNLPLFRRQPCLMKNLKDCFERRYEYIAEDYGLSLEEVDCINENSSIYCRELDEYVIEQYRMKVFFTMYEEYDAIEINGYDYNYEDGYLESVSYDDETCNRIWEYEQGWKKELSELDVEIEVVKILNRE